MMNVGLHIRGSIDATHTYTMLIHQNDMNPVARVRNLRTNSEKELHVRLSELFWNKIWFEQNPRMLITKHRKFLFRKYLLAELGKNSVIPTEFTLQVEGSVNAQEYRIHFDFNERDNCRCWIREGDNYQPANIEFSDLQYAELRSVFPKLKESLEVQIVGNHEKPVLQISLKGQAQVDALARRHLGGQGNVLNTASVPSPRAAVSSIVLQPPDVAPVGQLAIVPHDRIDDTFDREVTHDIVNKFVSISIPSEDNIQEVIECYGKATTNDQFRILAALMENFAEKSLIDPAVIHALKTILTQLQRIDFKRTFQEAHLNTSSDHSEVNIDRAHLVQMLTKMVAQLNTIHHQPGDVFLLLNLLSATIALLDVMMLRKVINVTEDAHKAAYNAIAQFDDNPTLEVRYLANYGKQAFGMVTDDKTNLQSAAHRTYLVLQGLATLSTGIDVDAPWHIIPAAFEALPFFVEALTFQQGKRTWFFNLFAIRRMLFEQDPYQFLKFANELEQHYDVIKKEMDFNNPWLATGFVELLLEVLSFPHFGLRDGEVKLTALRLLGDIYHNNGAAAQDADNQVFTLNNSADRQQLQELVTGYLYKCTTHPQLQIREAAHRIIQEKQINTPPRIESFVSQPALRELRHRVIRDEVPLLQAMQHIKTDLEEDLLLVKESPYFIDLDARDEVGGTPLQLEDKIRKFLGGKNIVLTIRGEGGAGKSLGIKVFAEKLLQEYNLEGYFPIYIYLPAFLRDPYHDNLEVFFREAGVNPHGEMELKQRKVVFIMDSYDEVNFNELGGRNQNIYKNNSFAKWKNAKVIFLYKTGAGERERFNPSQGHMESFVLCPFDDTKIEAYIERYVRVREEAHKRDPKVPALLWTLEEYQEAFKTIKESSSTKLWSVIKNPFRLKVLVEIFPHIAKRHQMQTGLGLKDLFVGKPEEAISDELFEAYACVLALRGSEKVGGSFTPEEFLQYSIDIALKMDEIGVKTILWPLRKKDRDPKIVEKFGSLLEQKNEQLYKECLIPTDGGWTFMHGDYLQFLLTAIDDDVRSRIIQSISEYDYKVKFGSAPLRYLSEEKKAF